MALRITIDVFSGRPNPVVELDDGEAAQVLERLRPVRRLEDGEAELPPASILGYRGVVIEQVGDIQTEELPRVTRLAGAELFGRGLAHRAADDAVEDFICGSTGPFRRLEQEYFFDRLATEIERLRDIRAKIPWPVPIPWPWLGTCRCAPVYEPGWWNVPARQPFNNCYNYATNYRTDTFAQPGQAAGAMYTSLTCGSVLPAAIADELVDSPTADNACPSYNGHLVALVIAPGWDFHWYRKGRDQLWTHKPGGTPVTNVDNSGMMITDPRTADRGPYTDFCTFMVVMHGHIKVS